MFSTKTKKPTLVKRWGDRAFHPSCVIVHHVDSEVGMPMGYDFHRSMTLSPLGMYKHKTLEKSQQRSSLKRKSQNAQEWMPWGRRWRTNQDQYWLTNFNEANLKLLFFQQLTLITSGSASVSPVNRFLVLRNFLLLYLLSTVEEEACENGL